MSSAYRMTASVAAVALAAFAMVQLSGYGPSWCGGLSLAQSQRHYAAEARRAADLEAQRAESQRRIQLREELAEELIEGYRSLIETAAWFDHLNRDSPPAQAHVDSQPGRSHGERVCRHTIEWARVTAAPRSESLAEEVGRRLEAELDAHLRRHGTVDLSPVGGQAPAAE